MSNFDSSKWFRISDPFNGDSLCGTNLYDDDQTGAAFMNYTEPNHNNEQLWQIWSINSTFSLLRSLAGGPFAFLGSKEGDTSANAYAANTGNTVPYMANASIVDKSALWMFVPWHDGTFAMANAANGSDWHLKVDSSWTLSMNSDITAKTHQQFVFHLVKDIDDPTWSTMMTPAALVSPTATTATTAKKSSSTTNTANPTTSPSQSSSQDSTTAPSSASASLPASAQAGIDVGAALGIIGAVMVFLLFWRRRKRANLTHGDTWHHDKGCTPSELPAFNHNHRIAPPSKVVSAKELPTGSYHEMSSDTSPLELSAESPSQGRTR